MNHSLLRNYSSIIPQQNRSAVYTDTEATLTYIYQLIIITGALFLCICCLYTLIYCVETTDNRRRRGIRLVITPSTVQMTTE
jgi:hypothetical protein